VAQLRSTGQEVNAQELMAMIAKRDRDDQERTLAPLQKADDALSIDTTSLDIDEVCTKMLEVVQIQKT
jgi:CMP/dCMP kinase